MKSFTAVLLMIVCWPTFAADTELTVAKVDPREVKASLVERQAWIREQASGPNAERFETDYGFLIDAKEIGPNEARCLANLFFDSSNT